MNPNNPTEDELTEWAFSEKEWPDQNWDLFLVWHGRFDWYIRLAEDYTCPKRQFFIDLLYYVVGYSFKKTEVDTDALLLRLVKEAQNVKSKEVRIWRHKIKLLKSGDLVFIQEEWWSEPSSAT
ncbi:hypothetical protein [Teredinibacter sp. KSP-S5-2]|uniref:hypothetical protein n=1 Tax=Teredinibacter sp. KSP-S5-2 TaxID=3034506 RepID=UPI00293486AC|nr:hypothetical protein [Teredinibacter sp. KSP-S5-2]WNO10497.1 hypothetical protein P5V12_04860 [Teredinibacter sp. KSP-S5-2]